MDELPLSVYSPTSEKGPTVPESYLWHFVEPALREKCDHYLTKNDLTNLQARQQGLQAQIVSFTEQKIEEFAQYAEHLLSFYPKDQRGRRLNTDGREDVAYQRQAVAVASAGNTNNRTRSSSSSSDKFPLKSSLAKKKSSSFSSDSDGKKSSKRVMFALQDEVSVFSSDGEDSDDDNDEGNDNDYGNKTENENEVVVDDGDKQGEEPSKTTQDGTLLGGRVYMEPEELDKEMGSLSINGIVPGGLNFANGGDINDEYDSKSLSESEEMFEFDEALNDKSEEDARVAIERNDPEPQEEDYGVTADSLIAPQLGSSMTRESEFSVSGSFKPRPMTKYLKDRDDEFYNAPRPEPVQEISNETISSSVPIDIIKHNAASPPKNRQSDLESLEPLQASESSEAVQNHHEPAYPTGLGNQYHNEYVNDGALNMDSDAAAEAAFGSLLGSNSVNPARMSFSERLNWEQAGGTRTASSDEVKILPSSSFNHE